MIEKIKVQRNKFQDITLEILSREKKRYIGVLVVAIAVLITIEYKGLIVERQGLIHALLLGIKLLITYLTYRLSSLFGHSMWFRILITTVSLFAWPFAATYMLINIFSRESLLKQNNIKEVCECTKRSESDLIFGIRKERFQFIKNWDGLDWTGWAILTLLTLGIWAICTLVWNAYISYPTTVCQSCGKQIPSENTGEI
jgi:hypothetical protein